MTDYNKKTAKTQLDKTAIKQAASGRWQEIIASVGGIGPDILDGRGHPCPKCGGEDRFSVFGDFKETGGAICRHCHSENNGDGIATIGWLCDCDFQAALEKVAEYLGMGCSRRNGKPQRVGNVNIVPAVAYRKKMPLESFRAYGAKPATRNGKVVARVPNYNEKGEEHHYYDIGLTGQLAKGLNAKKGTGSSGLFLPEGRTPQPGETWLVVEGVKDAAALHGMGFPAVGLPTSKMNKKYAPLFDGVNVIIVPDADDAGIAGASATAGNLVGQAATIKIAALPCQVVEKKGKDVRDMLAMDGGEEKVRTAIKEAKEYDASAITPESKKKEGMTRGKALSICTTLGITVVGELPSREIVLLHKEEQVVIGAAAAGMSWKRLIQVCGEKTFELVNDPNDKKPDENKIYLSELTQSIALLAGERKAKPAAQATLDKHYEQGYGDLVHHHGTFYRFREGQYDKVPIEKMESQITKILSDEDWGRAKTRDVLAGVKALSYLDHEIEAPAWLVQPKECKDWKPCDILTCRDKLVHLPSLAEGKKYSINATPHFYTHSSIPFNFPVGPDTPPPRKWLSFLLQLWPDDPEAIEALQLWFGYCLTPDTSQQKMLYMIGPKRSGKGTIARVLTDLLGQRNVASPALGDLARDFGLEPLLGKTLAIFADARLGNRSDGAVVLGRLLSITGEDSQTINRKNISTVTCKLNTRLMLLSNELPRLSDASGAFASRAIILQLRKTFFSKEDLHLKTSLHKELPSILQWAIAGWVRLQEKVRLIQPESGRSLTKELADISSPVGSFVEEQCELGEDLVIKKSNLYHVYREWCENEGRKHYLDARGFGRDLLAACESVEAGQKRIAGKKCKVYKGITFRGYY